MTDASMPANWLTRFDNIPRLLIIEDDADIRITTQMILERHGFIVETASDGLSGFSLISSRAPDLAIIDIGMPVVDGLKLTRMIRETNSTLPVLILTARNLSCDVVQGLSMGADDYLTKPFDGDVLIARIEALLRRTQVVVREIEQIGNLSVDRAAMVVRRNEEEIKLTATEFRILELLLDYRGQVLSRGQILDHVWGERGWTEKRVVNVNIQRLRAKLSEDVIVTVRGAGYKAIKL